MPKCFITVQTQSSRRRRKTKTSTVRSQTRPCSLVCSQPYPPQCCEHPQAYLKSKTGAVLTNRGAWLSRHRGRFSAHKLLDAGGGGCALPGLHPAVDSAVKARQGWLKRGTHRARWQREGAGGRGVTDLTAPDPHGVPEGVAEAAAAAALSPPSGNFSPQNRGVTSSSSTPSDQSRGYSAGRQPIGQRCYLWGVFLATGGWGEL